jgi:hypothetical protein
VRRLAADFNVMLKSFSPSLRAQPNGCVRVVSLSAGLRMDVDFLFVAKMPAKNGRLTAANGAP